MKTRSTRAAMKLLAGRYAGTIHHARDIAFELVDKQGTATTRQVRATMEERKLLPLGPEHWLGSVFIRRDFEWTGEWRTYSAPSRNIHERTIRVWRRRPERRS